MIGTTAGQATSPPTTVVGEGGGESTQNASLAKEVEVRNQSACVFRETCSQPQPEI